MGPLDACKELLNLFSEPFGFLTAITVLHDIANNTFKNRNNHGNIVLEKNEDVAQV